MLHALGPPTTASPTGGWFLDDDEIGFPFLERVRALGPPVVAVHKGIGGPIPSASVAAASPRDIGPAAAAFPDVTFVVYHSGYERDPDGEEGAYDPDNATAGVDRLVRSLADAGIGPGANVYAELGSTWFLMLRRPVEAAHVLGKLLARGRARSHRVGHRLDLVRLTAAADRRVPRVQDPGAHAGASSATRRSRARRRRRSSA